MFLLYQTQRVKFLSFQFILILSQLYFNSSSEVSENFLSKVKSTTVFVSVFVDEKFVGNLSAQIGSISCQAAGSFSLLFLNFPFNFFKEMFIVKCSLNSKFLHRLKFEVTKHRKVTIIIIIYSVTEINNFK